MPDQKRKTGLGCVLGVIGGLLLVVVVAVDLAGPDLELAKKTSDHLPVSARFRTEEKYRDRK